MGSGRLRPFGPNPVPSGVYPEGRHLFPLVRSRYRQPPRKEAAIRLHIASTTLAGLWAEIPAQTGTGVGRACFNTVAGVIFSCRPSPCGRRISSVSGTGAVLRDQPSSLRFGHSTAFTVSGRRQSQIARLAPPVIEASPAWLAFAAGRAGLAPCPSVNRVRWLDSPGTNHISAARSEVLRRKIAFALSRLGRSALRPFRAAHTAGPAEFGNSRSRVKRIASNLWSGRTTPRAGTALRRSPCGPQRSKLLSGHLQPDVWSVPDSGRRLLSETSAGPSRGRHPAFINSRIGLSHQPIISVRVCIPLARTAGG
jgi:hypothetical protein